MAMLRFLRRIRLLRIIYITASEAGPGWRILKEVLVYLLLAPFIIFGYRRPKVLVVLFADRFGHLMTNTEFFFSDALANKVDTSEFNFFALTETIDSPELIHLLERAHKIKIFKGIIGRAAFVVWSILGVKVENLKPKTEPDVTPYSSKLANIIPEPSLAQKYVTLAVRNGNYSKVFQGAAEPSIFRDTSISVIEPSIADLMNQGYDVYLVNNNPFDADRLKSLGVKNTEYSGLENAWSLMSGANFHIDTCTATSLCAAFSGTLVVNLNTFFGPGFNSKFFTNQNTSFVLPMRLYDCVSGRFLKIQEIIEFQLKMEADLMSSTVYSAEYMSRKGLVWLQNPECFVNQAISEARKFSQKKVPTSKLQNKFWEVYPTHWANINFPMTIYHDRNVNADIRISSSSLENYL